MHYEYFGTAFFLFGLFIYAIASAIKQLRRIADALEKKNKRDARREREDAEDDSTPKSS